MNDFIDRRPPPRVRAQLDAARTAGTWMPWAGAGLAALLWGGIGVWLIASLGVDGLMKQSPLVMAGGFVAALSTGLALVCAGIMAREGARSSEANQLVLTSARLLLEPAEATRAEVATLAEALADTRQRFDTLKRDIEASVTGAMKAAEIVRADSEVLVHKMSSERQSMTQLAESLRNQSEALAKSIPRHAQMMSEAARAAQDQVRQADATLDQRLRDLQETAGHLASRIDQLDTMGAESRKRAQNLGGALSRLDEQLVQSTRMVEAATKAGELAAAAAKSTAESLRDNISDALNSALKATETINSSASRAADEAKQAMTALKDVGVHAEATTRAAAHAARQHADETEKRINQLSESLFRTATRATNAAEDGLERARQRIEKASHLIGRMKDDHDPSSSVDDLILEPTKAPAPAISLVPPPVQAPAPAPEIVLQKRHETPFPPLFAIETPRPVAAPVPPPAPAPVHFPTPAPKPTASGGFDDPMWSPMRGDGAHDDELVLDTIAAPRAVPPSEPIFLSEPLRNGNGNGHSNGHSNGSATWRGLLSAIEEVPPQVREQSAGQMIDRLDRAGVRLHHLVKAPDLRRIATASHHGDRQRRRAIRDVAPDQIQRVSRMLETDRDLQQAARSFITHEEPDALRVLSMAERAREDAAPRLSAYLLLDAAMSAAL